MINTIIKCQPLINQFNFLLDKQNDWRKNLQSKKNNIKKRKYNLKHNYKYMIEILKLKQITLKFKQALNILKFLV